MKYAVDVSVDGFFHWEGDAPTKENAQDMAIDAACEADFGQLEDIDFSVYQVEKLNQGE